MSTDLHIGGAGEAGAEGFRESSFCAFCASRIPESGEPCCDDYAATLELVPMAAPAAAIVAPAPAAVLPAPAVPSPPTSRIPRLYVLLGLLVLSVSVLGVELTVQMRNAAAREQELATTRRLSEEMIALVKEVRREPVNAVVAPSAPAVEAAPSAPPASGQIAAVAPPVAPVTAPAPSAVSRPEMVAVVPASEAAALPPPAPVAAARPPAPTAWSNVSPGGATWNPIALAPPVNMVSAPPVVPEVAQPPKPAPRVVKAAREKIEARRPSATTTEPITKPAEPAWLPAEAAKANQELASLPPAVVYAPSLVAPTMPIGWTKLVRGMSRKEVRRLLGAPRSTELLMTGEFWYYAEASIFARGWVVFSDEGNVIEWLTP